jgi:hypothetical protein
MDSGGGATFPLRPASRAVFVEPVPDERAPQVAVFMAFDAERRPEFLFAGARLMKRVAHA